METELLPLQINYYQRECYKHSLFYFFNFFRLNSIIKSIVIVLRRKHEIKGGEKMLYDYIPDWVLASPEIAEYQAPNTKADMCDISDVIIWFYKSPTSYKITYHNCMTGIRSEKEEDVLRNDNFIEIKKSIVRTKGYYIKKLSNDFLVVEVYKINVNSIKVEEKRNWEYLSSVFIHKSGESFTLDKNLTPSCFVHMVDMRNRCVNINSKTFIRQSNTILHEFLGSNLIFIRGLSYVNVYSGEALQMLFSLKLPIRSMDKMEKLRKISLSTDIISKNTKQTIVNLFCDNFYVGDGICDVLENFSTASYCITQKINNNLCVVRMFRVSLNVNEAVKISEAELIDVKDENNPWKYFCADEHLRLYISDREVIACKRILNNWYPLSERTKTCDYLSYNLGWESETATGTKLQYFENNRIAISNQLKLISEADSPITVRELQKELQDLNAYLFNSLIFPVMEQFDKSPYKYFASMLQCYSLRTDIKSEVESLLGIKTNSKSFRKDSNIPAGVFQAADDYAKEICENLTQKPHYYDMDVFFIVNIISSLKNIFLGQEDYLSRMNNEQAYELTYGVLKLKKHNILQYLVKLYGPHNCVSYVNNLLVFFEKYPDNITLDLTYRDYLHMVDACKDIIGLAPWKFNSHYDLIEAHTNMVEIYNKLVESRTYDELDKKFQEQRPKWEKLKYEEAEFSVIIPNNVSEIALEGVKLHHCVSSYIDSVCNGSTVILFVRRIDDINTPFYTLEVKNGSIRQCHGFGNSNTKEVNGLNDFLKRYCEATHVTYTKGEGVYAAE